MEQHNNINGIVEQIPELSILDRKPLVTYAGDKELFLNLESTLAASLPQEATEWRRSYGRAIKSIHVSATFVPFTKEVLPKEGDFHLIEQPMLHTYWTQCSDVETYKTSVRDDIELWMRVLIQYNLTDWMIVLVETYDFRKSNKLIPRTTVLDKIRGDFGAKHADRCLSVINPLRSESRSAGSWRGLIVNFRLLLLTAYDRTLLRFEEIIRDQRERRTQPGWSFTKYFLLQEELAFVLEMLGVYEEALVQYDELDALFTQFVLNSHLGESPSWLTQFCTPLDSWAGLTLTPTVNVKERSRIQNNTMTLLQFRNYLFSRQCAMLLYAAKPWEVAERTLPFLHNCIRELSLLEVSCSLGAVPCWVFLSCLEVLHTCLTYTESAQVEQYSLYTAGLWAYARQKLAELGNLCGLMPGKEQTSEEIHRVVEISSGLDESSAGPVEKLKQALSSQKAFCKQYLELSELAMGTYKHIGRVRCARGIGHDLAKFYSSIGDYSTATSFLQNALHCYEQDGWKQLASTTRLELAQCYLELGDLHRYVKTCTSIASSPELDMSKRMEHYEELCKVLKNSKADPPWTGLLTDCMTLTDIDIQVDKGSTTVTAVLGIKSGLPIPTYCSSIAVSVIPVKQHDSKQNSKHKDNQANCRRRSKEDLVPVNPILQRLPVVSRLDYQQDKSLAGANVDIRNQKNLLRRQDSHGKYRKISTISRSDFTKSLSVTDIVLQPGHNVITLTSKDNERGTYRLGQFSMLLLGKLDLLSSSVFHKLHYEITQFPPSISLNTVHDGSLLAGIQQMLSVEIKTGGYHIREGSVLKLHSSFGLTMHCQQSQKTFGRTLDILLPETEPNQIFQIPVTLLAQLPSQKDSSSIEHTVSIKAPWADEMNVIPLSMQPALMSTLKLHTARFQKFLHVTVSGLSQQKLSVKSANMSIISPAGVRLLPANPPDFPIEISTDRKVGYMWLLETEPNSEAVKTEFTLHYEPLRSELNPAPLLYKCTFEVTNHKTMYFIESKVEPVRGSEFCRVSTVCQLVVKVRRVNSTPDTSLMYEVLGEHNMWAICGRTTGVLSLDVVEIQTVTLDVMPLINGFLPLPMVRLSKYIPAKQSNNSRTDSHPRLEAFTAGEVYNVSKGTQVHVIAAVSPQDT